jgi:hypothetical protein
MSLMKMLVVACSSRHASSAESQQADRMCRSGTGAASAMPSLHPSCSLAERTQAQLSRALAKRLAALLYQQPLSLLASCHDASLPVRQDCSESRVRSTVSLTREKQQDAIELPAMNIIMAHNGIIWSFKFVAVVYGLYRTRSHAN